MNWLRALLVSFLLVLAGPGLATAAGFGHGRPGGGWGHSPGARGGGGWDHGGGYGGPHRGWGRGGGYGGWRGGGYHDHGHVHFGFYLGAPLWPYWGGWGPWYAPESRVIINNPPAPTYYSVPVEPAQSDYWYYCGSAKAYYPYVKTCPEGWMQVVPQAPSGGAAPPR